MKNLCPCEMNGADGTRGHNETSGITFRRVSEHSSTVTPCKNHLTCYEQATRNFERMPCTQTTS
jgi:hypothetical protein